MSIYVAERITQLMIRKRIHVRGSRILCMGLTFKENCPDLRNSKVVDVVKELKKYGAKVDVYDPWIDAKECMHEYGIRPIRTPAKGRYDAIVIAVAHNQFRELGIGAIRAYAKKPHVLYDIKYLFGEGEVDGRLGVRAPGFEGNGQEAMGNGERPSPECSAQRITFLAVRHWNAVREGGVSKPIAGGPLRRRLPANGFASR